MNYEIFKQNGNSSWCNGFNINPFSSKSNDSNEVNMGETVTHQQTVAYNYSDSQEAVKIVKALKAIRKGC